MLVIWKDSIVTVNPPWQYLESREFISWESAKTQTPFLLVLSSNDLEIWPPLSVYGWCVSKVNTATSRDVPGIWKMKRKKKSAKHYLREINVAGISFSWTTLLWAPVSQRQVYILPQPYCKTGKHTMGDFDFSENNIEYKKMAIPCVKNMKNPLICNLRISKFFFWYIFEYILTYW